MVLYARLAVVDIIQLLGMVIEVLVSILICLSVVRVLAATIGVVRGSSFL